MTLELFGLSRSSCGTPADLNVRFPEGIITEDEQHIRNSGKPIENGAWRIA
jgi:hypothetical protein